MPALDRAVAFAQVDGMAETIHRHLDLDVAVVLEELLQVQGVVAKAGLGLGAADLECGFQLARLAHEAHALAAAAGRRLDQDRIANPRRLFERVGLVAQHARAGDRGQAVGGEDATRGLLRCEALQHFGRGTDERQAVGPDDLGEALVLRQETVAGVDGVTAGDDRGGNDCGRGEVAALGVGRPDADGLVGQLSGQALPNGLAGLGQTRADDPVHGRYHILLDAEDIDGADLVAGADPHADGQIAPRVVYAHCRGHGDDFVLLCLLGIAAATFSFAGAAVADTPGVGGDLGGRGLVRLWGRGGLAQSRLPAALANLDLAQAARR